jgi:DNA-binding MarR family transcriptional regulator
MVKTGARADGLDLDRFLPYRLDILAEGVSRALSRIYKERHGLGVPEWRVLAHLGQYAPITAKAVGAHSRMHKTKVSRAVAELERLGLIARSGSAADRREAPLSLTAKGRAAYEDLAPRALAFERTLLSSLSTADRAALERAIDGLLAALSGR